MAARRDTPMDRALRAALAARRQRDAEVLAHLLPRRRRDAEVSDDDRREADDDDREREP
jgi:hypothetical protein